MDMEFEALARYEQHVNPSLARLMRFLGLDALEVEGEGSIVRDSRGKEYIDCASGFGVFFHGHRHPRITGAVKDQLERMPMSSRMLIGELQGRLGQLLAEITPGDLEFAFFSNSGAESIEAAIKFARISTGRTRLVCTEGAFHGKTMGALTASGRDRYKQGFEPLVPGFTHVPFGDAEALSRVLDSDVAAVLLEPIQGENGVIVPPPDYLGHVRDMCDGAGALLILDEVQTGMGRTGRMFACEHYGVAPDIMCLSKALGGGVMPIGATLGTQRVWEFFLEYPLLHSSTFGGNQLACAAAIAGIEVTRSEDLVTAAAVKGEHCLQRIRQIQDQYPGLIVEARGMGLLIGMEFSSEGAGGAVMSGLVNRGVLAVYTLNNQRVIRFAPPAVITKQQLEQALSALSESIADAGDMLDDL